MPDPFIALLTAVVIAAVGLILFWPERGLFQRWQRARWMTERVFTEDALKHIHNYEMRGRHPTVESIAGALNITMDEAADIIAKMEVRKLLFIQDSEFHLTSEGRDHALHIIRAHRLWERYLADETGYLETEWHDQAERFEHTLSPAETNALSARLGHPTHDLHGDPIPTASGELVQPGGRPLTNLAVDTPARIVHLEDEPQAVYAQLVAEGLHVGSTVLVTENSPQRIRFWANGDEHVLAPILAANISVAPLPKEQMVDTGPSERLTDLRPGQKGKVVSISQACRGAERRRLMDLGILPGTLIEAEMRSPTGDPTAYRVRDAVIALRRDQASQIRITRLAEVTA
jgi:DtxR family Mn-dependent transcriptional regulator